MEKKEFVTFCPLCQKTHTRLLTLDEFDFLKECEGIVDTLMYVDECENCKKSAK